MSEVMRWKLKGFLPGVEGMSKAVMKPFVVLASDYDALAAQRDEGLAREAELRKSLAEAHELLTFVKKCLVKNGEYAPLSHYEIDKVLGIGGFARPGCADGEKAE